MSWLFIDSSQAGQSRIGSLSATSFSVRSIEGRSDRVVRTILQQALSMNTKKTLEGIVVVSGPGSFSAIRAGVVTANILARIYRCPLKSVTVDEAKDPMHLQHVLDRLVPTDLVLPVYDAEPNIT